MSAFEFSYWAPELLFVLFSAAVIAGVITGYFWWGSSQNEVEKLEREILQTRESLARMEKVHRELQSQIDLVS